LLIAAAYLRDDSAEQNLLIRSFLPEPQWFSWRQNKTRDPAKRAAKREAITRGCVMNPRESKSTAQMTHESGGRKLHMARKNQRALVSEADAKKSVAQSSRRREHSKVVTRHGGTTNEYFRKSRRCHRRWQHPASRNGWRR
jgi:hypothetical protein